MIGLVTMVGVRAAFACGGKSWIRHLQESITYFSLIRNVKIYSMHLRELFSTLQLAGLGLGIAEYLGAECSHHHNGHLMIQSKLHNAGPLHLSSLPDLFGQLAGALTRWPARAV